MGRPNLGILVCGGWSGRKRRYIFYSILLTETAGCPGTDKPVMLLKLAMT